VPSGAVFLSYASGDAAAAERICTSLRAAGIEVWFDRSELRGGDAWDQSIRKQIKGCALFVPVISRNSHDRDEGYFRLEWKLAVDRCHLMAADKAFLLPVVIDDTRDDERVPERFREVQWTRLPNGVTPAEFVERVRALLSGGPATAASSISPVAESFGGTPPAPGRREARKWKPNAVRLVLGAVAVAAVAYFVLGRFAPSRPVTRTGPPNSIAVLPLANLSGDPGQQYFSDGLSEDLITALSQFPGLKVIGHSSSFKFRDSKEDSGSIGTKLGVAHLLEGSVRRAGDVVRVSTELIDASDGSTQWSDRYDRSKRSPPER
jgi:TolB-like protein